MMKAAHGWWCNTRTFPTVCKYCSGDVFYFSCDCGSKLFFDSLGYPWPIHHCAEYKPSPTLSRLGQEDLSGSVLSYLTDSEAEQLSQFIDQNIERDYAEGIRTAQEGEKRSPKKASWIIRQDPYHDCKTTERGIITELIQDANILKKANIREGSLGVSMLGKYATVKLAQITVHTSALAEDKSENCSFTFFVEASVVRQLGLVKGCFVVAQLWGIVVSPKHPIWVCEQLTDLYGA